MAAGESNGKLRCREKRKKKVEGKKEKFELKTGLKWLKIASFWVITSKNVPPFLPSMYL